MSTRSDHREAVARRLELLHDDPSSASSAGSEDAAWWEPTSGLELVPPVREDPGPAPGPPAVPVPGRHVDRRPAAPAAWLAERAAEVVPEALRHRARIGPWHLAVVAVIVAVGLAITCWWVMRSDPSVTPVASGTAAPLTPVSPVSTPGGDPTPASSPVPVPGAGTAPAAAGSSPAAPAATVIVDVAGKVRHPGVVDLPAGSRVIDAIRAAGGARPRADLSSLNRARVLVDGEQIMVGRPAVAAAPVPAASGVSGTVSGAAAGANGDAPTTPVNLNTATVDELDTLPGVGPVTAQAIVDYRTQHGRFGSVDELLDVARIGEATLAKIAPHVTVG